MENAKKEKSENIEEKGPPQYLYKYYSFNKYTERIIVHNEIYFAKPLEFNDPFDSKPALDFQELKNPEILENFLNAEEQNAKRLGFPWDKKGIKKAIETMVKTGNFELLEERFPHSYLVEMGIFCMAKEKDNILMWSHYSDSYKGFCLEFEEIAEYFPYCLPVYYENQRPSLNMLNMPPSKQVAEMSLTKAELWEYEKEWRIIDFIEGPGVKTFPHQLLTSIIIGYRMEERDRADLNKWCHERENKPKLYEARPNKKEFKVDIFEVSYPS